MVDDIFTNGISKVREEVEEKLTEGLEIVDSVYSFLETMFNHVTGNDIEIFPDYCQLPEEYRMGVKERLESEDRSFYYCEGCGGLDCIGHPAAYNFLSQEQKNEVNEWKRYICRLDKNRGIEWDEDIL